MSDSNAPASPTPGRSSSAGTLLAVGVGVVIFGALWLGWRQLREHRSTEVHVLAPKGRTLELSVNRTPRHKVRDDKVTTIVLAAGQHTLQFFENDKELGSTTLSLPRTVEVITSGVVVPVPGQCYRMVQRSGSVLTTVSEPFDLEAGMVWHRSQIQQPDMRRNDSTHDMTYVAMEEGPCDTPDGKRGTGGLLVPPRQ